MTVPDFYTDFFQLDDRPFTLLPDPGFLFWTPHHQHAFSVLEYGVMSRAPITVITGEVGAGKTTLIRKFLDDAPEDLVIGLISNAQGGRGELLQWILNALGQTPAPGASYVETFQALQDFLIDCYGQGKRVALIIDEAQNLSVEGLEELRMLTNINSGKDELVQLILVGQPELRDLIRRPSLRQFAQRVAANYHLPELDAETTAAYIRHRLVTAGGTGKEFTRQAAERVHAATGGVPRLINQLCDFAMVYAASGRDRRVLSRTIDEVLDSGVFFAGFTPEDFAPQSGHNPDQNPGHNPPRTPGSQADSGPGPRPEFRPAPRPAGKGQS